MADPYFHRWRATNVIPQKQTGYCIVHIMLQLGDITTDQLRTLSDITAKYSNGRIRVTHQQNLLMRWVRNECVYELYKELKRGDMALAGVGRMTDIQSCPGAETCNLGLTSSRQLARAIGLELSSRDDAEVENVKIKVSGCPELLRPPSYCGHWVSWCCKEDRRPPCSSLPASSRRRGRRRACSDRGLGYKAPCPEYTVSRI